VQLQRSYADIDIVIGRKDGRAAKTALLELGYLPNERFNALRGDRRMLFYDTVNGRQLDVFVGTFDMCHKLDLSDRLTLLPGTLSIADLFLTKLQSVEINTKDLVDVAQLLRNHEPGRIRQRSPSGPRPSSRPSTSSPSRCAGRRAPA